jgi:hypothetical protein
MIELDGREVKVGDKMWSPIGGWCRVEDIDEGMDCIDVVFLDDEDNLISLFANCSYYKNGPRCLFWDEVKIIPPPPPKEPEKKWIWTFIVLDAGHEYTFTPKEHMTEERAYVYAENTGNQVLGRIAETEIVE